MPLRGKLGFNMKLSFGVGQAAEGFFGAAYGTFLIFYYNQVLGMPGDAWRGLPSVSPWWWMRSRIRWLAPSPITGTLGTGGGIRSCTPRSCR